MKHLAAVLFGWPNGICTGNLLASLIWGTPAVIRFEVKMRRLHRATEHQAPEGDPHAVR